jgi:predicted aconitase
VNRTGTIEVKIITQPRSLHDWDMLGFALGNKLPAHAIPVFTGEYDRPNAIQLKTFFASLACSAGTEMCHIVGLTPEAPDLDTAFRGQKKYDTVTVNKKEIDVARESLNPPACGTPAGSLSTGNIPTGNLTNGCNLKQGDGKIDYISIGCPHLHIEEIRQVARFLTGRKVHPDTGLDIWTTGPMLAMARRCGYAAVIEGAGANLVTGGCPSNRGYPKGTRSIALDASKQRQDAPGDMGEHIFFGSRNDCLESAIRGVWAG